MATLTSDEIASSLNQIYKLLNDLQVTTTNLASKAQLKQLTLLIQKEVADHENRITSLEAQLKLIQDS